MSVASKIELLKNKTHYEFSDLCDVMAILRSEEGCPWDREQDHHSIRTALIEETYEVVEAIDTDNPTLLCEELGDLLFQIMFHAQIEVESERFAVGDVIDGICKKMIHRHPHVFGTVAVADSSEVLRNWESIKTEEKQRNTTLDKLRAIPPMMPALMRASKVGKKAGEVAGCDAAAVLTMLENEIASARAAMNEGKLDAEVTVGRLLMQTTNFSRVLEIDAEYALTREVERIIEQFAQKSTEVV